MLLTHQTIVLWHGTTDRFARLIVNHGVQHVPPRYGLDFGAGFYTTTNEQQAKAWANRTSKVRSAPPAALVRFDFLAKDIGLLLNLSFVRADANADDYWDFVNQMKYKRFSGHFLVDPKNFDVVSGPVSLTPGTRKYKPDSDQFSFHTDKALQVLNGVTRTLIAAKPGPTFVI